MTLSAVLKPRLPSPSPRGTTEWTKSWAPRGWIGAANVRFPTRHVSDPSVSEATAKQISDRLEVDSCHSTSQSSRRRFFVQCVDQRGIVERKRTAVSESSLDVGDGGRDAESCEEDESITENARARRLEIGIIGANRQVSRRLGRFAQARCVERSRSATRRRGFGKTLLPHRRGQRTDRREGSCPELLGD